MSIAIIGGVGVPASYGGFETLSEFLIEDKRLNYTVYCSKNYYKDHPKTYKRAKLVYIPINANGFSSIFYDITSIIHACCSGHKKLLILGLSGALIFPFIRFIFPKIQIITNIDGFEWKRPKFGYFTQKLLRFFAYIAIKFSNNIIADNKVIADYLKEKYNCNSSIITYGGDHALISDKFSSNRQSKHNFALSVCRIEPENNIHLILEAFSKMDKNLKVVGNWGSSKYGKDLKLKYASFRNIELINPEYNIERLFQLRASCYVYIHGHSAGGTNPSLVEIMHFSKPVIAFDCDFNRATMDNIGHYFSSTDELINIMDRSSLNYGNELKKIANTRYTWENIRDQYFILLK